MIKLRILVFASLFVFQLNAQSSKLFFERFNTSNGLSNNRVYCILQDSKGFMWFGTLDGLNRYDGYSFEVYKSKPDDTSSYSIHNNRITVLFEDKEGYIWIGTEKNGVEYFNPKTETFHNFPPEINDRYGMTQGNVVGFKEVKGELFVVLSDGVCRFDRDKGKMRRDLKEIDLSEHTNLNYYESILVEQADKDKTVLTVLKENFGKVWIGTQKYGLFISDKNGIVNYTYPPFEEHFEIRTIYQDKFGIIWIGTRNNGLFKHNPATRGFTHYNSFKDGSEGITDLTTRAITEDKLGNIWVGTYNDGLLIFNREKNSIKHVIKNEKGKLKPGSMIRSLYTDKEGNVWIGSYDGIALYNSDKGFVNGFEVLPESQKQLKPYVSNKLHCNRVYGFNEDKNGLMWIANWDALSFYNKKTRKFKHYPAAFFGVGHIREVMVDKNNTIWFGCEFGGMVRFNTEYETFERFYPKKSKNNLVCENVFTIYESTKGEIWVTTFNGLDRINPDSLSFMRYFTTQGLPGNMVYGILEDKLGQLWFTTTNGLSKYNPTTDRFLNFGAESGLVTNEFAEGAYYKSKITGEFFVGGINGFHVFHPDSIKENQVPPELAIVNLKIKNKTVKANEKINGRVILKQSVSYTSAIELTPDDNIVTFEFVALHYSIPEKNKYRYKLDGFDADWVETTHLQRSATYTNLDAGDYIFRIQGANSDGVWGKESSIKVKVLPPFWLKWWAFLIYAGIFLLILAAYRFFTIKNLDYRNSLELEKIQREKSEEINRMKMNFFTGISHEFRTPLTLIMAPLNKVLKAPKDARLFDYYTQLESIDKNTQKLHRLVGQILDLRKLESGKLQLRSSLTNVEDFVIDTISQFKDTAKQQGVQLNFHKPECKVEAYIDIEKFEIIVNNLLSNALKFSNKVTGTIDVWLNINSRIPTNEYSFSVGQLENKHFFEFSVKDNGIGIPARLIYNIFNQFYRVDNAETFAIQGSGIGLAITKELIMLHGGQVLVKSVEGEESLFTVRFPMGKSHLRSGQIITEKTELKLNENIFTEETTLESLKIIQPRNHLKTMLIVEDNKELSRYLCSNFVDLYNVIEAENGKEAIDITFNKFIDIIICDIAMPKMNGIEFCKRLKNDNRTSHIPIVLLSAYADDDHKLQGYSALADGYIEKPFNADVMIARISSLIINREKVKMQTGEDSLSPYMRQSVQNNPLDNQFLDKINDSINEQLSDVSLNVESLSRKLNISRSTMHLKLKALTGQSANEYIRAVRINKAAELLKERRYNILEISYQTGFNSASYFIKCFKNKYGVTPKEYMDN